MTKTIYNEFEIIFPSELYNVTNLAFDKIIVKLSRKNIQTCLFRK